MTRRKTGFIITVMWLLLNAVPASAQTIREGTVIDGVTIVDVRTGRLAPHQAVLIVDGRIVDIAPAGTIEVAGTARIIEGANRFLVPGFNDMHVHTLAPPGAATELPLMLASGITGFRQMAGAPPLLAARSSGRLTLPEDAPALLAMPGAILTGAAFADPAAATAEVERQTAQGADFIKVVDLPPAAFAAAAQAARVNHIPFAGHLPLSVNERDAMRQGMASIEHLGPGISVLLNCSSDEAAIRAMLAGAPAPGGADFAAGPEQVRRMLVNPMLVTPPQAFGLMARVLATYDAAKCRAFAADVAASDTWMVPTLTRLEAMELGNTPALRDNPDLRYAPAESRALWTEVGDEFDNRLTPAQRQTLSDLFEAQLRLTAVFDREGVKMLAGTDFGGGWIVAGQSLHHEFDLLSRSGLRPLRILQMTTVDPATFLGRETTMGVVEEGRNADLVLLDSDPTESVAALHQISGVIRAGRYYDRAELDAIKAQAAATLQ